MASSITSDLKASTNIPCVFRAGLGIGIVLFLNDKSKCPICVSLLTRRRKAKDMAYPAGTSGTRSVRAQHRVSLSRLRFPHYIPSKEWLRSFLAICITCVIFAAHPVARVVCLVKGMFLLTFRERSQGRCPTAQARIHRRRSIAWWRGRS